MIAAKLAAELARERSRRRIGTFVAGLCGAQGSGKSTLARAVRDELGARYNLRTAVLSLDDLYLTGAARRDLAARVHPLFVTRGPPGTHDVDLGLQVLRDLAAASGPVLLPRFDKATDEPLPQGQWVRFAAPADVVLFEGWCVGARPERPEALAGPVNTLEADEDAAAVWRTHINTALAGRYQAMFARLHYQVLLGTPSFDVVFEWRRQPERKRAAAGAGPAVMDDAALKRFVAHYERLTRHILGEMPGRADLVIALDRKRLMRGWRRRVR